MMKAECQNNQGGMLKGRAEHEEYVGAQSVGGREVAE